MSETPRADAFDAERSSLPAIEAEHDYSALLDFARTLERENAALREKVAAAEKTLKSVVNYTGWQGPIFRKLKRILNARSRSQEGR